MGDTRISGSNIAPETISATQLASKAVITSRLDDKAVTQAKIGDDAVGLTQVEDGTLDGTIAKNVAGSNTEAGLLIVHYVLADQAGGADKDVTVTHKVRVLDVIVVNKAAGGAGDTITVKNGATAITDAIDTNKADKTVTRAGTIDDAAHEIAAAGTLRVSKADGANDPNCEVYVVCMRVA